MRRPPGRKCMCPSWFYLCMRVWGCVCPCVLLPVSLLYVLEAGWAGTEHSRSFNVSPVPLAPLFDNTFPYEPIKPDAFSETHSFFPRAQLKNAFASAFVFILMASRVLKIRAIPQNQRKLWSKSGFVLKSMFPVLLLSLTTWIRMFPALCFVHV